MKIEIQDDNIVKLFEVDWKERTVFTLSSIIMIKSIDLSYAARSKKRSLFIINKLLYKTRQFFPRSKSTLQGSGAKQISRYKHPLHFVAQIRSA